MTLTIARVKEFLKSPKHWMPIVGAIIVFLTFVVKEGLGERWRELAEAIDTAQYMYLIRVDANGETLEIQEVNRGVARLSKVMLDRDKTAPPVAATVERMRVEDSRVILDNIQNRLAILKILTDKLPEDLHAGEKLITFRVEASKAELEKAAISADRSKAEATQQGVKLDLRYPLLGKQPRSPNPGAKWCYSSENSEYFNSLTAGYPGETRDIEFEHSLEDLNSDIDSFNRSVLKQAEEVRNDNRTYASIAWWMSAGLYALGWGLGLLGKLSGVPEAAGEA